MGGARRPRADQGRHVLDAVPEARSRRLRSPIRARRSSPAGTLGTAIGTNTAYQRRAAGVDQGVHALPKATTALCVRRHGLPEGVEAPPAQLDAQQELATAAQNAGNPRSRSPRSKRYLKLDPNSPQSRKQIEKQDQDAPGLAPSTPNVKTGGK